MSKTPLFEARSPLGYNVVCSKKQWYAHVKKHKIMTGRVDAVKGAIENPYRVYGSSKVKDRDVYFGVLVSGILQNMYVKVVAAKDQSGADVITSFATPEIKGGIDENELKYIEIDYDNLDDALMYLNFSGTDGSGGSKESDGFIFLRDFREGCAIPLSLINSQD